MSSEDLETTQLLERWHDKDPEALQLLLERHLPWLRSRVRRSLGTKLRAKEESVDIVQDAAAEFLRYGPRFRVPDTARFRALLARIVENVICDKHDWYTARRRAMSREQPLAPATVLELGGGTTASPPERCERAEWEAWVRLGLELLDPEDRQVVVLRQWDNLSFEAIGEQLGLTSDGARMRFNRALPKLAMRIKELQRGSVPD